MKWPHAALALAVALTTTACKDTELRQDMNQWAWGDPSGPPAAGNGTGIYAWQVVIAQAICQLEGLHTTTELPPGQRLCPNGPGSGDPVDPPRPPDFDD